MNANKSSGADKTAAPASTASPQAPQTIRRTRVPASRSRSGSRAAKKPNGHANGSANHAARPDEPTSVSSGFVSLPVQAGTNTDTRRPAFRANGRGQAFSSDSVEATPLDSGFASLPAQAGTNPDTRSPRSPNAGSDDASGASVAIAAASAAAGTVREACAELAGFQGLHLQTLNEPKGPSGTKRCSPRELSCQEQQPRVPSESQAESAGDSTAHPPGDAPLPEDPAEFVEEIHQRVDLFEIWRELLDSRDEKIKQRAVEKLTEMRYKGAQSFADEPQQIVIDIDSAVARRAAEGAKK